MSQAPSAPDRAGDRVASLTRFETSGLPGLRPAAQPPEPRGRHRCSRGVRASLALTVSLFATLAFPALAAAKGPSSATMTGPGISGAEHLNGYSEGGPGSPLGVLTMGGGFFAQAFAEVPEPTHTARPQGTVGPRYEITYVVPGPSGGRSVLRQDFYPYARPAPLTYMKPGQTFWSGTRTHGGWFVAPRSLPRKLGLPAQPPRASGTILRGWPEIGGGVLIVSLAIALLLVRLRPRAGPVSA